MRSPLPPAATRHAQAHVTVQDIRSLALAVPSAAAAAEGVHEVALAEHVDVVDWVLLL